MQKKFFVSLLVGIAILTSFYAYGEQIPKVGTVDIAKIYLVYYMESKEVREFEKDKTEFKIRTENLKREIETLELAKAQATIIEDETKVLEIQKEIDGKKEHLATLGSVISRQLELRYFRLNESVEILKEILEVIQRIAESEGFSLIIDVSNPLYSPVLFYIPEFDIT